MASTITASTLKVTIQEDIKLNGVQQGGLNTLSIESINEVSKRIVTIPSESAHELINCSGSIGMGSYVTSSLKYVRISNLNSDADQGSVNLVFRNYDNDEFAVKVDYGQSFLYPGSAADGVSGSMDAIHSGGTAVLAQDSMNDLKRIIAHATGSNVDLEIFTAST